MEIVDIKSMQLGNGAVPGIFITCTAIREAGEGHHENAGGSLKLSAVATEHTMQIKERHYEKVGRILRSYMKASGDFIRVCGEVVRGSQKSYFFDG